MRCDIVIKSFSRDYDRCAYLLESIRRYLFGYQKIFLFLDDEAGVSKFVCERVRPVLECDVVVVPSDLANGYMLQQFYKLNGGGFSDADYLLPLDSDMVVFRRSSPADWLYDGKAFIHYGQWRSPHNFPPTKLISELMGVLGRRTHDINAYLVALRSHNCQIGVKILEDHGSKIVFDYDGLVYDLDADRPHATWLSSIKNITDRPIDTMRTHYMFTRPGLTHVKNKINEYTNKDLRQSILSVDKFPVFSEYQVYGNLVKQYEYGDLGHIFVSESDELYARLGQKLPIVKCNTRVASAETAYREIVDGRYANGDNRYAVLDDLRKSRAEHIGEDWH